MLTFVTIKDSVDYSCTDITSVIDNVSEFAEVPEMRSGPTPLNSYERGFKLISSIEPSPRSSTPCYQNTGYLSALTVGHGYSSLKFLEGSVDKPRSNISNTTGNPESSSHNQIGHSKPEFKYPISLTALQEAEEDIDDCSTPSPPKKRRRFFESKPGSRISTSTKYKNVQFLRDEDMESVNLRSHQQSPKRTTELSLDNRSNIDSNIDFVPVLMSNVDFAEYVRSKVTNKISIYDVDHPVPASRLSFI